MYVHLKDSDLRGVKDPFPHEAHCFKTLLKKCTRYYQITDIWKPHSSPACTCYRKFDLRLSRFYFVKKRQIYFDMSTSES